MKSKIIHALISLSLLTIHRYHACTCYSLTPMDVFKDNWWNLMTVIRNNNEASSNSDTLMTVVKSNTEVSSNKDTTDSMNSSGKKRKKNKKAMAFMKSASAYRECTDGDGTIDDMTDKFPFTSSGNQWFGLTDSAFGGESSASITREKYEGKTANVLRGKVIESKQKEQNESFIQMATNLALNGSAFKTVDVSKYSGIKLTAFYDGLEELENFCIHFRTPACRAQLSAYRANFELSKGNWKTIQIPWDSLKGIGPGSSKTIFEKSAIRRLSIVALGEKDEFTLAISRVGFY